ncbi:hypothetical protein HPB47_016777 [Ixodes persulcatus]|uniref:Uncharacterized protein n=1 Tax=Ixodes persulcatus TaxID=34615 RepID=A0AC60QQ80_IXOPE|nr:hypothetical protein HPB47_016777 [Ixodes persulcatus]
MNQLPAIADIRDFPPAMTFDKFTDMDSALDVCADLTDEEIVRQVLEPDSESDSEDDAPAIVRPSNAELTQALMLIVPPELVPSPKLISPSIKELCSAADWTYCPSSEDTFHRTVTQCRWELWRFATNHYCLEISTAKEAYSFLNNIGAYADLPRFFGPCTKSDGHSCHLLDQLDIWNHVLQEVGMLLEEVAPETLSVSPQRRASDGLATGWVLHPLGRSTPPNGWVLLHWLFKEHRCIANLQLFSPNKRSQLPLGDALSQNFGLRMLTLSYETGEEEFKMIYSTIRRWTMLENLSISGLGLSNDSAVLLETSLEKLPSLRSLDVSFWSITPACDAAGRSDTRLDSRPRVVHAEKQRREEVGAAMTARKDGRGRCGEQACYFPL